MLRFIYGFDPSDKDCSSVFQIQLMVIADKYAMPSLYASAKEALAGGLRSMSLPDADYYPDLLEQIYAASACDSETRHLALAVCHRDMEGWLKQEDFHELLLERPDISRDILSAGVIIGKEKKLAKDAVRARGRVTMSGPTPRGSHAFFQYPPGPPGGMIS